MQEKMGTSLSIKKSIRIEINILAQILLEILNKINPSIVKSAD